MSTHQHQVRRSVLTSATVAVPQPFPWGLRRKRRERPENPRKRTLYERVGSRCNLGSLNDKVTVIAGRCCHRPPLPGLSQHASAAERGAGASVWRGTGPSHPSRGSPAPLVDPEDQGSSWASVGVVGTVPVGWRRVQSSASGSGE